MLGLVFTEFIELVEHQFSPEVADAVLQEAAPHGGAYTAVGYYPHEEIVALVVALSRHTGVPVPDLVRAFGRHLLGRFTEGHAEVFARHGNLFELLAAIDSQIHVEVRKLYDQATLPRFTVLARDEGRMGLFYESPRGMDQLALGLIEGAAAHYGEPCDIALQPHAHEGRTGVLFTIARTPG